MERQLSLLIHCHVVILKQVGSGRQLLSHSGQSLVELQESHLNVPLVVDLVHLGHHTQQKGQIDVLIADGVIGYLLYE